MDGGSEGKYLLNWVTNISKKTSLYAFNVTNYKDGYSKWTTEAFNVCTLENNINAVILPKKYFALHYTISKHVFLLLILHWDF